MLIIFKGTGSNAAFVEYVRNIEKWNECYKDEDPSDIVCGNLSRVPVLNIVQTKFVSVNKNVSSLV